MNDTVASLGYELNIIRIALMDPSLEYLELLAAGEVKNRYLSAEDAKRMLDEQQKSHAARLRANGKQHEE